MTNSLIRTSAFVGASVGGLLLMVLSSIAQAHLMVAQHGTLNIVGDSAYMVLSVPVSAFEGVDDDGDSKLSAEELAHHRLQITRQIHQRLSLSDDTGNRELQGMMMTLVADHEQPTRPSEQMVLMGRFDLLGVSSDAAVRLELFGLNKEERQFTLSSKIKARGFERKTLVTPTQPMARLFPAGTTE